MAKLFLPEYKTNYFCLKVCVAANFSETKVETIVEAFNGGSKVPRYEENGQVLTDSNSIARKLSNNLQWGTSDREQAEIYQWIEFADKELHPSVAIWGFPFLGLRNYNKQEVSNGISHLDKCLKLLDDYLLHHMFLVGNRITQADVSCAAALFLAYQLLLGPEKRHKYMNVTRWFRTIVNQPQFRKELANPASGDAADEVPLCEETPKYNKQIVEGMKTKLDELLNTQANNNTGNEAKPKSAAQLKKEAKKREKMEKFNKKMQDKKNAPEAKKSKSSEKVEKKVTVIKYEKNTPPGDKKDITDSLPDSYSPQYVEAAWYSWWEKEGFFKPEYGRETPYDDNPIFMICLPPPNVTGSLHLGHALTNTVEDVLVRWHRMMGKTVLWNPGTDHAGIATQVVVEKKLWREKKQSRHDIGREAFVEEVWKWKREKGNRINDQLRRLGSTLDWSREFFTMNDQLSFAVKETFIRLHERGVIFRSNRLVNWSCTLKSAISDIEVNKQELPGRTMLSVPGYEEKVEFGVLISFAYPVVDGNPGEELIVATTRIETMLGDSGVAVHPEDDRYKHLHGKKVQHPFCDRQLPIVCDEMVERDFGTGAVKITPSHDANDYECGKRHNLSFINIFSDDGLVINTNTEFDGMKRFHARTAVLKALQEKGLYKETKENPMVVPICSRSKDIVEPLIKLQWFMDCKDFARQGVEAVRNGDLKIIPDLHCKTWYHWLENIRDWCISRQLWWGHRIPAYFVTVDDPSVPPGEEVDGKYWMSGHNEEEVRTKAAERFNVCPSKISLRQDEDVLDTWFSSGLLPFSIFGWPNQTQDLNKFFPGTLLETGHDIIFFWVARMVMFALGLTGKLPFKEVYFHAMVRDAHGRKMSKSLGNVIDPLDVVAGISLEELHKTLLSGNLDQKEVERAKLGQKQDYPNGIPECGSDALRFALCAYTCQGKDINLDVNRILGYRHFCNKLWNAFKFATRGLGENFAPNQSQETSGRESEADRWILSKLSRMIKLSSQGLETYEFPVYTTAVFNFWLYELCDVYLECLKPVFSSDDQSAIATSRNVLYTCLEVALRITQPLMPFICEELWQRLPRRPGDNTPSVMVSKWPDIKQHDWSNDVIEAKMDFAMNIVKVTRSLRGEYNLTKTKAKLYVHCTDDDKAGVATEYSTIIQTLSYSSKVEVLTGDNKPPPGCAVAIVNDKCDVNLMLKGIVDLEKEIAKLRTKQAEQLKKLTSLKEKMSKSEYKSKVPENVQTADAEKVQQMETEIAKMKHAEEDFLRILNA
uniref:Valine--tRNA ligase n=1 Tax=Phallusia mammillata TaxID=59560 RepID=A0A6F9DX99_9ASCI|nr:valine--tRNA ligase-like [Phallusia mammillata]